LHSIKILYQFCLQCIQLFKKKIITIIIYLLHYDSFLRIETETNVISMKNNFLPFVVLVLLFPIIAIGQVDRTFWFVAPNVSATHGDTPILLRFAAFNVASTVTISMPANLSFTPIVVNVPANSSVTQDLTASLAQIETPFDTGGAIPTPQNTGILIEATEMITAYYEVNRTNNPDIFALKGSNALGKDFYLPLQKTWNSQTLGDNHTGFLVVATEDNTTVTVTPTVTLSGGRTAGVPYTVTLNRGQTYCGSILQPTGANMPSGTRVQANKPVAVTLFSDSIFTNTGYGGCYDLVGDQLVPTNIVGTQYMIMRGFLGFNSGGTYGTNPERVVVLAIQANTNVTYTNTATVNVNLPTAGSTTEITLTNMQPFTSIIADKPVYVFHYAGFGCETGGALLPAATDCSGSKKVRFIRSTGEYFGVTILAKVGTESNFSLNGGAANTDIPATAFQAIPGSATWKAARISFSTAQLAAGSSNIISNSAGLFHLGIINGGESSGCRYGYFSSFNAVNLGPDINISYGSFVTLDAGPDGLAYLWNTGATTQTINVPIYTVGDYHVAVTVSPGCVLKDTVCVGTAEYVWTGDLSNDPTNINNWSRPCGVNALPDCNTDIIIPLTTGGKPYPVITGTKNFRDVRIEPNATLTIASGARLNVCRNFMHYGNLVMQPNATIAFIGTQPQTYTRTATGVGEFENLIISNTTTPISDTQYPFVRIADGTNYQNLVVSPTGTLTFENGYIVTENAREIVVKNRATNSISGYSNTRFVVGRLRRYHNATGSYDYPVGLAIPQSSPTLVPAKAGTLTNMNTATCWQTANYNAGIGTTTVLDFDGVDDFIQMPAFAELSGTQPRTIELWARVRSFTGEAGLFQFGNTSHLQDFSLRVNGSNDNWRAQFWGADYDFNTSAYNSGAGLLNKWTHYALSFNGTQICVYIDGALVNTCQARALNTNTVYNYIARWRNGYLNGQIDEVRIWNYARTSAQITASMSTPLSGCNAAGLVAYYNFEEGSGTTVNHYNLACVPPQMVYQLANVNFTTATTNIDNLLAYFNQYTTVPTLTGQPTTCGANFNCQVLNNGFWTINAFNNAGTQISGDGAYTLTLYNTNYTNAGVTCSGLAANKGGIMKRTNNSSPWAVNIPGYCVNDALTSVARGGMVGFSDFATALTPSPVILPVELLNFSAKLITKNTVKHTWQTATEKQTSYFLIERSKDGFNFGVIGRVEAAGNSTTLRTYDFLDNTPFEGLNYYRLKIVDKDGSFSYSKIVAVNLQGTDHSLFNVFPNPAGEGTELKVALEDVGILQITLTNMLGQVVHTQTVTKTQTNELVTISKKLPKSTYILHVATEQSLYREKVIVE
jgi:hypothetical protein